MILESPCYSTEYSLFLNGIYKDVLEEIIKSSNQNQNEVFYLQPKQKKRIKRLWATNPTKSKPLLLLLSISKDLNKIWYTASIVGWKNKNELVASEKDEINKLIKKNQPNEGGLLPGDSVNLIEISGLKELSEKFSVTSLIKIRDNIALKKRTQPGHWCYVRFPFEHFPKLGTIKYSDLMAELETGIHKSSLDTEAERQNRLKHANKMPEKVKTIATAYRRNPDVIVEVLKRAKGICEKCNNVAPFNRSKDGTPFLEVHHKILLSDGGEDTVENAIALCPNCHRELHFGR